MLDIIMINVRNRAVVPERQPLKMRPSQAAASEAVTLSLTATNRAPYAYVYEWFTATIAKGDRVSQRPAVVCVFVRVCARAYCDTSY